MTIILSVLVAVLLAVVTATLIARLLDVKVESQTFKKTEEEFRELRRTINQLEWYKAWFEQMSLASEEELLNWNRLSKQQHTERNEQETNI